MHLKMLTGISRNEGGIFFAVRSLAQALCHLHIDVGVISHIDEHTFDDMPRWDPLSISLYSSLGPLKNSLQLRRILKQTKADLLHVHGLWRDQQWAALQWQIQHMKPVVVSPHGMLDPWAVSHSAWKKKIIGKLFADAALHKATCLHALCQAEVLAIREYGLNNPIALIPNGIDLPDLPPAEKKSAGIQNRPKRLLFLGRIHPKKGIAELIRAWGCFVRTSAFTTVPWQLLIVGWDDGGHRAGLQRLATDLHIKWRDYSSDPAAALDAEENSSCNLFFYGPLFDHAKDAIFRTVDAFILPSFSEGLPMSVLEAWAYELPVTMTDFCNIPEGFAADAALRIEPNRQSIAGGLERLAEMADNELIKIGRNGRVLVERNYTWPKLAHDMASVYRWCLGGEQPGCVILS
jgi:glycosyltransferase involved in cell wall biosynthesis